MSNKFALIYQWFSEYFKFCPLTRKKIKNISPLLVVGHRGSPSKEIENTIPSLELAYQEGANGLEIDLCITKDNVVILWHDWNPNDTTALLREAGFEPFVKYKPHPPDLGDELRGPIPNLLFEEVKTHFKVKERKSDNAIPIDANIATLEQFFEWTVDKPKLKYIFLDIKTPENAPLTSLKILDKVKELYCKHESKFKIVIETCVKDICLLMKKHFPEFEYSLDIEPRAGIIFNPKDYSCVQPAIEHNNKIALALRPRKVTIANWTTYRRIIRHDLRLKNLFNKVSKTHTIDKVVAATVSKKHEMKCLLKMGIDGIQTDYPEQLMKIAKRYKREIE